MKPEALSRKMKTVLILTLLCCTYIGATSVNVTHVDPNSTSNHYNTSHDSESHTAEHVAHGIHLASFQFEYVRSPLLITVFLLAAGIAKLGFHQADFLSSRVPESCLLIILGIIVGAIFRFGIHPDEPSKMPGMDYKLFFLFLLPPIILESAWSLHDRTFFDNVGTVLIYAVIGTVLNCFLIGPTLYGLAISGAMGGIHITMIQCLVFSAIIVAVDPVAVLAIFQEIGVNNVLYFLVFGESLLNDAVTVVLYNMMKTFNEMTVIPVSQIFLGFVAFFVVSCGGIAIGLIFGMLTAFITKYTEHVRVIEPLSVFVLAYMSYLMAELFHFSGIISIIACGLTQAQYAFHNISSKSRTTVKYFSKMQSSISDCIIFVFLGIALFKEGMFKPHNWHLGFIMWTLFLCLVYRFLVVFGLTWIINRSSRMRRIGKDEQFIMAYGGLRGAVAFSLMDLLDDPELPTHMFTTTLMTLIFFTVFVQGITIKPLVKLLQVKLQSTEKKTIGEEINAHVTDHVMAGIEEVLGHRGEHHFREILEFYNSKYLKHWLQKYPTTTDEHIMSLYEKIALQQHFESLAGSKMVQDKYIGEDETVPLLIPEDIRNKILHDQLGEEDEDEYEYSSEASGDETVLPSVTVPIPTTGPTPNAGPASIPVPPPLPATDWVAISPSPRTSPSPISSPQFLAFVEPDYFDDLLDKKLAAQREDTEAEDRKSKDKTGRRKSIFPFMNKRRQSQYPSGEKEPTAMDVRKILDTSSRRNTLFSKFDKNLRNESSGDLLKCLQEKQLRTRRMSRAVMGGPGGSPKGSQTNIHSPPRRTSVVAANAAAHRYKHRLSLAVPERPRFQRDRSPSDVTGVQIDRNLFNKTESKSPEKRHRLKKGATFDVSPLVDDSPRSSYRVSGRSFYSIPENQEVEDADNISRNSSGSNPSRKRHSRLKKSNSVNEDSKHDPPIIRSYTAPTSDMPAKPSKVKFKLKSEITPKQKKSPMQKSKSLDSSYSSHSSKDDPSETASYGSGSPDSPKEEFQPAELKPLEDHGGRKSSYTEAMSHIIPENDDNIVENTSL